jgi:hypothetical protein
VPQFQLEIADGGGNVNTQTSQVDNFITQKVDLLLISPSEAGPLTPAVKRAIDAGTHELPKSKLEEQGGTPRDDAETSSQAKQPREDDRDDSSRNAVSGGDTTKGDPAKQHIPRLEELQREADERHQHERDDRDR